jgi:general secretion pathway protein K
MVTLAVLTVLVTEMIYTATVRHTVALHRKERTQARWIAHSGLNLYRLVLVASKDLERNEGLQSLAEQAGINFSYGLWEEIPALDTGLMRMQLVGLLDPSDDAEDFEEAVAEYQDTVDEEAASMFSDSDFLTFDGDFYVTRTDHESRLNINAFSNETTTNVLESSTGQALYALMSGLDEDQWFYDQNLDRWDIISNLKDWVDTDTIRSGTNGGFEDDLYNQLDDPYLSKNAPFDTMEEIRLVDGWQDNLFERYGDQLTVFGDANGKINVTTADDPLIKGIIRACATSLPPDSTVDMCLEQIALDPFSGSWNTPKAFSEDIMGKCGVELDSSCINQRVTNTSKTFTVTSTGIVGTTEVTITAVLDFSGGEPEGELLYWRVD